MKKLTALLLACILLCGIAVTATAESPYPLRQKTDMEEKRGVYYEIFVRSFADSDGDGVGDFNGVTAKLDYLKDLGIEGIWLMPINASDSYHGYDVTDYYTVNEDYGTEADFQTLLDEAHKRGIKIIMDFVINHTSSNHPWFRSSRNVDSEYRDYYTWVSSSDPDYDPSDRSDWGSNVWQRGSGGYYYYGMFSSGMPDLNYENPKVRQEVISAAQKWLEMGVDGFRLDAAMHIYGNHEQKHITQTNLYKNLEWWNEFAIACEEVNPDVYLVGEAWKDDEALAEYAQPFDTKFNFAFEENMIDRVTSENAMLDSSTSLAAFLEDVLNQHYAADAQYLDGVFGTNHDQNRIMSTVENEQQAKLVANIYMTLDGNPYIYYGEEIGMRGQKPDERIREPFKWTDDGSDMDTDWTSNISNRNTISLSEQMEDKNSLYHYYKELIATRKASAALTQGKYTSVDAGNNSIMAYTRTYQNEKVYVYHNFSGSSVTLNIPEVAGGEVLFKASGDTNLNGNTVTLGAYSSIFIQTQEDPQELQLGDVNNDGSVTVGDVLLIQKHVAHQEVLAGVYYTAADVDRSGTVDLKDVLLVQKKIANMIPDFS